MKKIILGHCVFLFFLCTVLILNAQERLSRTINSNWNFYKGDDLTNSTKNIQWEKVTLPHSWNTQDVEDDKPGYYRGIGWYKKTLYIPAEWRNKEIYVYFEGAAQVAEVFINGISVGKHIGSYNFFSFPIHHALKFEANDNSINEITVKVNNSHSEDIAPLSADFTFFGGLYRDVYLKVVDPVHFDMNNYASSGVFISTPKVNKNEAEINIKGAFTNQTSEKINLTITHQVLDAEGTLVAKLSKKFKIDAKQTTSFSFEFKDFRNPHLWSTEDPYLYKVISTISDDKTNKQLDEVSNPLGFRWFNFDADKGFFLNGISIKLIGASRHQDFKNMGNALTDGMQIRDVELLKQMGGNFLRIAHYPQDPSILEACDRLGILTSVETPIVNRITESTAFSKNSLDMHLEMIRQNYNHPSLIIWAYMNEVLLRPRYEKDTKEQENYFNAITKLAHELEDLTRKEDPYRYTLIPNHGNLPLYKRVRLTSIPKLIGWSLYQGWYGGNLKGFGEFLDQHHKELPNKPLLITEYGADADSRLHNFNPVRFDKTVEYSTIYHQAYLKAINERPFVSTGIVWNLAEFNSEERAETMPHINNKGILTLDRKPKDAYLFYQARLLKTPYIQLGAKEWVLRSGFEDKEGTLTSTQQIQVFTNQININLKLNGIEIGSAISVDGVATFKVPYQNGLNSLVVYATTEDKEITDQVVIQFDMLSQNLKSTTLPFKKLNISMGDQRFFFDEQNHELWLPEQEYKNNSWGYVGGQVYKMSKTGRQSYGSDKNILNTDLDPVYETQRIGIQQFRFDVPDGDYELTLHFAELLSNIKKEELPYNLNSITANDDFKERVFNVRINNKLALSKFSNKEELEPEISIQSKFSILVKNNKGIIINFEQIKAETILNGIQLIKIN